LPALATKWLPHEIVLSRLSLLGMRNLAKVGVEGSNPFARSKFPITYG